jgi:hypothetical protein
MSQQGYLVIWITALTAFLIEPWLSPSGCPRRLVFLTTLDLELRAPSLDFHSFARLPRSRKQRRFCWDTNLEFETQPFPFNKSSRHLCSDYSHSFFLCLQSLPPSALSSFHTRTTTMISSTHRTYLARTSPPQLRQANSQLLSGLTSWPLKDLGVSDILNTLMGASFVRQRGSSC